jgi:signal transduction histidine kinase
VIRRLVLSYVAITLVVLGVLVVPLGVSNQRRQLGEVESGLERDAFVLATLVEDGLEAGGLTPAARERLASYAEDVGARVVVVDGSGMALVDTDAPGAPPREFASRPEFAAALQGRVTTGQRRSDTLDDDLVYAAVPVASGGNVRGAVRVTYPSAEVDERVRNYWLTLGGVAAVSLAVVAVVGVLLARSVARPLRDIEDAARDIGQGDLTRRVPSDRGPAEVRSLATAFNRTASRLEELVGSQEAFVADASHQLRTPLTALRLRLENLQADVDDAPAAELEDAVAEVERLARLVDGLLVLARADRGDPLVADHDVAADTLLEDRAETWRPFAEERDVTLAVDAPAGLLARADPDRLTQVLDNLIANALDAAGPGTTVVLRGAPVDGRTALHVIDNGPGLTDEQRERAFDRFWRADHDREGLGGSGLGLSIVAKLVAADGGTVRLDPADGGGVDAVVELPG